VLSELFAFKGYACVQATSELECHWRTVAGDLAARHSRPRSVRGGVLEIVVDNSALLQELASFQREALLEKLQCRLPELKLRALRFCVGPLS
jgi:predicted nucleic acid-binding Zn ribbon protein